jgi:hypothetical protein
VVPGVEGGAGDQIPATSPAGSTGEVAREGPGAEGKRLGGLLMSEGWPAVGDGGRRRRRPRGKPLRRVGVSGRTTSARGGY